MAKNDNLKDFLTDVADAIREKKGTTGLINPQDFSNEISSIQSGQFDGIKVQRDTRVNYSSMDNRVSKTISWPVNYDAYGNPNTGIFYSMNPRIVPCGKDENILNGSIPISQFTSMAQPTKLNKNQLTIPEDTDIEVVYQPVNNSEIDGTFTKATLNKKGVYVFRHTFKARLNDSTITRLNVQIDFGINFTKTSFSHTYVGSIPAETMFIKITIPTYQNIYSIYTDSKEYNISLYDVNGNKIDGTITIGVGDY